MTGIERIAAERTRQIEQEGWSAEHDSRHVNGELALAAALYAAPVALYRVAHRPDSVEWYDPWPWQRWVDPPRGGPMISVDAWDKREKHSRIHRLEIAGALIAAEIDRLTADGNGEKKNPIQLKEASHA